MKKNRIYIILFVVLSAIAAYFIYNKSSGTIKKELRDFAVADTSAITKIFLADREGNTILLERKSPNKWMVNNKFEARVDGINNLLYTIKALEVRSPVGKNLYNHTMKLLAAKAVKTEVYTKEGLIKTYYVGHPTMDNQGTFMYLEGSTVPFIMHIPGFSGFLTTRYFTNENDWRSKVIFSYSLGSIASLEVNNLQYPDSSIVMTLVGDSAYQLSLKNGTIAYTDSKKIIGYVANYSLITYESIAASLTENEKDSLVKAGPFGNIKVNSITGEQKELTMYRKPVSENTFSPTDETGKKRPFDMEKFYLRIKGDDLWYRCQYFQFDRLLKTPSYFAASSSPVN